MTEIPRYRPMGDRALLVELGNAIDRDINERVRKLFMAVLKTPPRGLLDAVPAYCSLLLKFDPREASFPDLQKTVDALMANLDHLDLPKSGKHQIPVVYGGEQGPDLAWVARYHQIPPEEVITRHTQTLYHVYMIGFIPGFPYMGELPKNLVTPRKTSPRTAVPKGSVGLAQQQTGIYPTQSPGGWQIIGRTPLLLFNPSKNPPTLLQMGDQVRFFQITEAEGAKWAR